LQNSGTKTEQKLPLPAGRGSWKIHRRPGYGRKTGVIGELVADWVLEARELEHQRDGSVKKLKTSGELGCISRVPIAQRRGLEGLVCALINQEREFAGGAFSKDTFKQRSKKTRNRGGVWVRLEKRLTACSGLEEKTQSTMTCAGKGSKKQKPGTKTYLGGTKVMQRGNRGAKTRPGQGGVPQNGTREKTTRPAPKPWAACQMRLCFGEVLTNGPNESREAHGKKMRLNTNNWERENMAGKKPQGTGPSKELI